MSVTIRYRRADPDAEVFTCEASCRPEAGTDCLEQAAADAASDYHQREGWEASWPLVLVLVRDDGTEIGRCEIQREMEPYFYTLNSMPG